MPKKDHNWFVTAVADRTCTRCFGHASQKSLNVTGSPHGVRHGWFNWPWNFDPIWLEQCDGFEKL